MTPAAFLRDIAAAQAAQRQYAHAYDRLAERAQMHAGAGHPLLAGIVARQAFHVLRAWENEWKDPEPRRPA